MASEFGCVLGFYVILIFALLGDVAKLALFIPNVFIFSVVNPIFFIVTEDEDI